MSYRLRDVGSFAGRVALRRVIWIIVGVMLYGLLGLFSEARASAHTNQAEAFKHCHDLGSARVGEESSTHKVTAYTCTHYPETPRYQCATTIVRKSDGLLQYDNGGTCQTGIFNYSSGSSTWDRHTYTQACPADTIPDAATGTCIPRCPSDAPPLDGGWVKGDQLPYSTCSGSCAYTSETLPGDHVQRSRTVDGETYWSTSGWQAMGQTCTAGSSDGVAPPSDTDGDGTSDGNDSGPNNPGIGGGGGGGGEDGSGQPGEGGGSGNGNTSGGGGNCKTPPHSTGDAILAQIAYQSWATRCAIEGVTSNGKLKVDGTSSSTTVGSGGGGGTSGNGNCEDGPVNAAICATKDAIDAIKGWFDGTSAEAGQLDGSLGETAPPESIWSEADPSQGVDTAGFGLGGSCPAAPTYLGESIDPDGNLCMLASLIGAIILMAAFAQAAYIIGR